MPTIVLLDDAQWVVVVTFLGLALFLLAYIAVNR